MEFGQALAQEPFILFEGAVIERLRRETAVTLDPYVLHAGLVCHPAGQAALAQIYDSYLDVGQRYNLPMAILTPTWRANPERVSAAGLVDVAAVNQEGYRFLDALRNRRSAAAPPVWVGGLTACRGDAYQAREALPEDEARRFHAPQVQALAEAGVDFLIASTLPALSEALGIAAAMAETGVPYLLSFVIRPTGAILDNSLLHECLSCIDDSLSTPPLAYMVNCVHPSVLREALHHQLDAAPWLLNRLVGLQANTSPKPPEELDDAGELKSQPPAPFAEAMIDLYDTFGLRILGGCCGTDDRHLAEIAARATARMRTS